MKVLINYASSETSLFTAIVKAWNERVMAGPWTPVACVTRWA